MAQATIGFHLATYGMKIVANYIVKSTLLLCDERPTFHINRCRCKHRFMVHLGVITALEITTA